MCAIVNLPSSRCAGLPSRSASSWRAALVDRSSPRSAARTVRKSAASATSWTRKIVRAGVGADAERRQRAGARRSRGAAAGERADEVLAEIASSTGARARALRRAPAASRPSGPASWRSRARVEHDLLRRDAVLARQRHALGEERAHVGDDVVVVRGRSFASGSARVCMITAPRRSPAQTSASAGSRRPLTSLTIAAPAAIAARATAGL